MRAAGGGGALFIQLVRILDDPFHGFVFAREAFDAALVAVVVADDHVPAGRALVGERLHDRYFLRVCHAGIMHASRALTSPAAEAHNEHPQVRGLKAMTARRAVLFGIAAAVIAAGAYVLSTPVALLAYYVVYEDMFPSRISWDGKTAWRRCDSAIAGKTSWPATPEAACAAMHLCANEVPLSRTQRLQLDEAIRKTPGCREP